MTEKDNTTTIVVETVHDIPRPVLVDLGSRKKKAINNLKNGHGRLMHEVDVAIQQARSTLTEEDKKKQVIPVIIVYRKKRKKRKSLSFSPLSALSPLNFLR